MFGLQTDKKCGLRLPTVTFITSVVMPLLMMHQRKIIIVCDATLLLLTTTLEILSKLYLDVVFLVELED